MLPKFELYRPTDLMEACDLKEKGAKIVAGGTDVFVSMHGGELRPESLVDIKGIEDMAGMSYSPDAGLDLGALTTHRAIEDWDVIKENYYALFEGCSQVGSVQIRHRGTLGGNICNAAPSADSIGALLVHDAVCVIAGKNGTRKMPLCEFFAGPKKTKLNPDEILTRILVPQPAAHSGSAYIKYTRRKAMDLALLGVSAYVEMDGDTIKDARIALTTAAPTPMRARKSEEMLAGRKVDDKLLEEVAQSTASEASPRTSWRSSKEFRLKLITELTQRALKLAVTRAERSGL